MPKLTKENIKVIQDALARNAVELLNFIEKDGYSEEDVDLAKLNYSKICGAFNAISGFGGGKHIKWADKFKEKGASCYKNKK